MAAILSEKFKSRIITTGLSPSAERTYQVFGTNDDAEALACLRDGSPASWDLYGDTSAVIAREALNIEPIGDELWDATATYSIFAYQPMASFDTGGGTAHVEVAHLAPTRAYAREGETAPNFHGLIGVAGDGKDANVEGIDIVVPQFHYQETHYFPDISVEYRNILFRLTGCVNHAEFKHMAAGECLFLGASGQKRGMDVWEITYQFAGSQNDLAGVDEEENPTGGITLGGATDPIEHISKYGWEHLWARFETKEDPASKTLVKRPLAAYVETVYRVADFGLLGIGI